MLWYLIIKKYSTFIKVFHIGVARFVYTFLYVKRATLELFVKNQQKPTVMKKFIFSLGSLLFVAGNQIVLAQQDQQENAFAWDNGQVVEIVEYCKKQGTSIETNWRGVYDGKETKGVFAIVPDIHSTILYFVPEDSVMAFIVDSAHAVWIYLGEGPEYPYNKLIHGGQASLGLPPHVIAQVMQWMAGFDLFTSQLMECTSDDCLFLRQLVGFTRARADEQMQYDMQVFIDADMNVTTLQIRETETALELTYASTPKGGVSSSQQLVLEKGKPLGKQLKGKKRKLFSKIQEHYLESQG
jgi:hypothetical protein